MGLIVEMRLEFQVEALEEAEALKGELRETTAGLGWIPRFLTSEAWLFREVKGSPEPALMPGVGQSDWMPRGSRRGKDSGRL